jgi:predicted ATPase/class 3 adenylate cyclase
VDPLVPYLPRVLLEWDVPATGPHHRSVEGTVAFVDISGFTAMSERLAKLGRQGAEEVTEIIGATFERLLSVAYDNGGALLKFGGDALLLLFAGPDHPHRACRTAALMRKTLREIGRVRTSAGISTLRMHVGIHTAPFDLFVVGDVFRELVLTGPAATVAVEMESAAVAGEILISAATADHLAPSLLGDERRGGRLLVKTPPPGRWTPEPQPEPADPAPFIPPRLRAYLSAAHEPEHRLTAVAFARYGGTDDLIRQRGGAAAAEHLDELVRAVQAAAERNLVTYIDNDPEIDGGKFLLVSGAPFTAERDGEQLLRTVREIIDARPRLEVRIGVNQGHVFSGSIGPSYRRKYSVMGDAVNLAARLMAHAEVGHIVAMPSVLSRLTTRFETSTLEPFVVKGKAEPVQAVDVGGRLGTEVREDPERTSTAMVGRRRELERLLDALTEARGGRGTLVEVVGEPGLGKSRLIEELRQHCGEATILLARGEQYETSVAYGGVRDLIRRALAVDGDASAEMAGAQLLEALAKLVPDLLPWAPLVAVAAHADVPPTPETDRLDELFKPERLRDAVVAAMEAALSTPTVVVVEDAHWLDAPSVELMRSLSRDAGRRPWLIVATTRPGGESLGAGPSTRIELEPLSSDDAAALLRANAAELRLPPHELAKLTARAGGNPLFMEELIRAVRAGRGIDGLPDTVEAVIGARIDRLDGDDRTLLRYAAVLGASFSVDLLDDLLREAEAPHLAASWLPRLPDFVTEEWPGTWRFRHALIRDVAYEALPYRRRATLHRRVGDVIERKAGEDVDEWAEMLSLHFHRAQEYERAWRYSVVAGEHAIARFDGVQATEFFRQALDAGRRLPDLDPLEMSKVAEALGDAAERIAAYQEAKAAYRTARRLGRGDESAAPRLCLKEGVLRLRLGHYVQALGWYTRGLRAANGGPSPVAVELGLAYAGVRYYQGKYRECISWCERMARDAKAIGDRAGLAHAYSLLYLAHTHLGSEERHRFRDLALPLYEVLEDLAGQANVLNNLGIDAYYEGDWKSALALYERSRAVQDQTGNVIFVADTVNNIAEILSDQGRLEEAERLFQSSLETYRSTGYAMGEAFAISNLGRLAARAGRSEDALELLREALARHRAIGDERNTVEAEARIAEALLLAGNADDALPLADSALVTLERLGGMPVLRAMLLRLRGCALALEGNLSEARLVLERSVEDAQRGAAPYEAALSLHSLGRVLDVSGDDPHDALEEAERIFEGLGVVAPPLVGIATPTRS